MARDPDYTPFAAPTERRTPRLELLERCWRIRALPTGRELVCGIFQTDVGLEVRAGYRDDLLHSRLCSNLVIAREVAEQFKRVLVDELGSIEELPLGP